MQDENLKKKIEDEVDDTLDSLYKSTINIDSLKKQNSNLGKSMSTTDFNLDKELEKSKVFVNINEINESDKFLKKRVWDSSNDNKIEEIEKKYEKVSSELDKEKIKDLIRQINNCKIERFYENFRPKINDKRIGSVSSLDFMIENTFNGQECYYDIMNMDKAQLQPYIYKFRSVLGDGDCFYRGLIFSLLENIILTNNIMLMKELLILYHEKINVKNKLLKDKEYLYVFYHLNISIVSQILYIFIDLMENNSKLTYKTLLKIFLYCPDFDFSIIYFTRYLIYEYISENENKIYSNDFQVEVGCLLPEEYVKDKGDKNEYFFENYYSMQLMVTKSFAEKIVVYITPFVFDIDMNILLYDFGTNGASSTIQEKHFSCENGNKSPIEINLLFRKAHYDIYYKQKYFEEYEEMFNVFKNIKEDIKVINKKREEIYPIENGKKSEIKKEQKLIEEDEDHILDLINDDENDNKKNKDNNNNKNNNDNAPICIECKKTYHNMNDFYLCDNCLFINLKNALLSVYLEFIKHKNNLINPKENLDSALKKTICTISEVQKDVPLFTAINNSNYKFEDLFLDIRSELCLYCGENLISKNDYYIELPCKCRICCQKCFLGYIKTMKDLLTLDDNPEYQEYVKHINFLNCFCGYTYHSLDILYMIQEMDKKKLNDQKEMYQDFIRNLWNWRCMLCHRTFNRFQKFYRIIFETDKIDIKLLKSKDDLRHLLCGKCKQEVVNDQKIIYCRICQFDHKIKKTKEVDDLNKDEGCVIF